jgi:hypothetical protein
MRRKRGKPDGSGVLNRLPRFEDKLLRLGIVFLIISIHFAPIRPIS